MLNLYIAAMVLCLTILSGCDVIGRPSNELDFTVRNLTNLARDNATTITVITSTDEIEDFKGLNPTQRLRIAMAFERYEYEFFNNNYLVIFSTTEGGGGFHFIVDSVQKNGDITMTRIPPGGATTMSLEFHSIVIELSNHHMPVQFSVTVFCQNLSDFIGNTEDRFNFASRYIRDYHYTLSARRGPVITVITSTNELEEFLDMVLEDEEFGGRRVDEQSKRFIEEFQMYDDTFFRNSYLLIITHAGFASSTPKVEGVYRNGFILLTPTVPSGSSHRDLARFHAIIELSNDDKPEDRLRSVFRNTYVWQRDMDTAP